MPSQSEIQAEITARILAGLKQGVVPWRKPWRNDPNSGAPANVVSHRLYSGINPLLLDAVAMSRGYTSKWWGTFGQWKSLGANVKKRPGDVEPGRWGTQIVFWKEIQKTNSTEDGETTETFPLLRYFTLFNVEQVEGEGLENLWTSSGSNSSPLCANYEPAQRAIEATNADIRFGGNEAFYRRPIGPWPHHSDGDYICMPQQHRFTSPNDFYSTAFHELVHWSEVRLNWTGSYPLGELIAEIGSCYIASHVGTPVSGEMSNHAAYVARWLKDLENDSKSILKASSQASKATGFVLSFSRQHEAEGAEAA